MHLRALHVSLDSPFPHILSNSFERFSNPPQKREDRNVNTRDNGKMNILNDVDQKFGRFENPMEEPNTFPERAKWLMLNNTSNVYYSGFAEDYKKREDFSQNN